MRCPRRNDVRRGIERKQTEEAMDENESLWLMYGWIALAVMNLALIVVAFLQYAS